MDDQQFQQQALQLTSKAMTSPSSTQSTTQLKRLQDLILEHKRQPNANIARLEKLETVVLTNLACLYRKSRRLSVALFYLKAVQGLQAKNNYPLEDCGATHSNLCAVLSEMGRHKQALLEATTALQNLELALQQKPCRLTSVNLIVGCYNYAVECEYLNKEERGLEMIERGLEESRKEGLDEDVEIVAQLREARVRLEEKKRKKQGKFARFYQKKYRDRVYFKNRELLQETFVVHRSPDNSIQVQTKLPSVTYNPTLFKKARNKSTHSNSSLDIVSLYKRSTSHEINPIPSFRSEVENKNTRTISTFQKTIENNVLQFADDRKRTRQQGFRRGKFAE